MKKIIFSLLVLMFANISLAGNEGPQATPEAPPIVLVERLHSGGFFVPPGALMSQSLQVRSNGEVVKVERIRGNENSPKTTLILTLSKDKIAQVQQLVSAVRKGEMVDPDSQSPGCQDAPSSRDRVFQGAIEITIAETSNCKKYIHENASAADAQLIKILNAIDDIE